MAEAVPKLGVESNAARSAVPVTARKCTCLKRLTLHFLPQAGGVADALRKPKREAQLAAAAAAQAAQAAAAAEAAAVAKLAAAKRAAEDRRRAAAEEAAVAARVRRVLALAKALWQARGPSRVSTASRRTHGCNPSHASADRVLGTLPELSEAMCCSPLREAGCSQSCEDFVWKLGTGARCCFC